MVTGQRSSLSPFPIGTTDPVLSQIRKRRFHALKRPNIKCPYCRSQAFLRPASLLDKTGPAYAGEKYYVCARYPTCDAYVKAHSFNQLPMRSSTILQYLFQGFGKSMCLVKEILERLRCSSLSICGRSAFQQPTIFLQIMLGILEMRSSEPTTQICRRAYTKPRSI